MTMKKIGCHGNNKNQDSTGTEDEANNAEESQPPPVKRVYRRRNTHQTHVCMHTNRLSLIVVYSTIRRRAQGMLRLATKINRRNRHMRYSSSMQSKTHVEQEKMRLPRHNPAIDLPEDEYNNEEVRNMRTPKQKNTNSTQVVGEVSQNVVPLLKTWTREKLSSVKQRIRMQEADIEAMKQDIIKLKKRESSAVLRELSGDERSAALRLYV
jgi:hypothetical protein